jgi:hypothetical protein
MYEGWQHAGFAASADTAFNATGFTKAEVGDFSVSSIKGSSYLSRVAFCLRKIVIQLNTIPAAPNRPTSAEVKLTWDTDGNRYITNEPLSANIQYGEGDATLGTIVIPVPENVGIEVPPKEYYTKPSGENEGGDSGVRIWAWVKLDSFTASGVVRVVTTQGKI